MEKATKSLSPGKMSVAPPWSASYKICRLNSLKSLSELLRVIHSTIQPDTKNFLDIIPFIAGTELVLSTK